MTGKSLRLMLSIVTILVAGCVVAENGLVGDAERGTGPGTIAEIRPFSEQLAAARFGDCWGFVNQRGDTVINPQFARVSDFSGALAAVFARTSAGELRAGYINRSGQMAIPLVYSEAAPFSGGLARVRDAATWLCGYILPDGAWRIAPRFTDAKDFSEGLAGVLVGSDWGYIDAAGRVVIEPRFASVGPFREGLAAVRIRPEGQSREKIGYIDRRGVTIIAPDYEEGGDFSHSRARVRRDSLWEMIDSNGRIVVGRGLYREIGDFHEGLARVCDWEGRWGYLNPEGREAIVPAYPAVGDFSEGLAPAIPVGQGDGLTGYLDIANRLVIPPRFSEARAFAGGCAPVLERGEWRIIDRAGRISTVGQ